MKFKKEKVFFWRIQKLSLLLVVFLLLCFISAIKKLEASEVPCRGLKPYNNLEELLYQFYINLDSDCLFKMSLEELEGIWNTKILSSDQLKSAKEPNRLRDSSDFFNKPFKTEKDAFFIGAYKIKKKNLNGFYINITNEYSKMYGTFFPDGHLPRALPEASKIFDNTSSRCDSSQYYYGKEGEISDRFLYFWLNSDRTSVISISLVCGMNRIEVMPQVLPFVGN